LPAKRVRNLVLLGLFLLLGIGVISAILPDSEPEVMQTSSTDNTVIDKANSSENEMPWDYKVIEAEVGDLVDGDMTILPENNLLPNDENYATGDKIWVLQNMRAKMTAKDNRPTDIQLSAWEPIKSYKLKEAAEKDLQNLKGIIKTEVDLVGVYKTEYQGKYRQFAVLKLPTGNIVKQPISEERYKKMKDLKKVNVILEQVHDFMNYDMAVSKFRGWDTP
jgi:hypothetical protein